MVIGGRGNGGGSAEGAVRYDEAQILTSEEQAQARDNIGASDFSGDYTDLTNTPTIPTATSDLNNDSGFITSSDIPAQVQSDWNEADTNDPAYIQNKPTIPAAPVQSNWNEADTNSLAYIQNKPTIPTATSDLNNDSGFITSSDIPAQVQSDWNEADSNDPAYIQNKPTIPAAPVQSNWNESDNTSLAYIQNKPTIPAAPVQSNWNEANNSSLAYIQNKPPMTTETWTFTLADTSTITRTVYIVPSYRVHVTNSYSPDVELEYSYDDDTYTATTDFDEYLEAGTSVWFRVSSSGSMPGEYEFTGWSDGWIDPDEEGDGRRRQITVTGNVTLSVEAEEIPSMGADLSVIVIEDGGIGEGNGCGVNVDIDGNEEFYTEFADYVPDGSTVTITAVPGEGYEFVNWDLQGDFDSEDMPDTSTDTITFTAYEGMSYVVNAGFVMLP